MMVVYIGYVDVCSALHHCGVVVCCIRGGASFFTCFCKVASVFLPGRYWLHLLLLLLQFLRRLFGNSNLFTVTLLCIIIQSDSSFLDDTV